MMLWAVKGFLFFSLLAGASYCDIRFRTIPDSFSILLVAVALIGLQPYRFLGILCGIPFLLAAVTVGGIGGADIKIMGTAGMVLGLREGMLAMLIGLSCMIIYHIGKAILLRDIEKKKSYPLIPFLATGMILAYLTLIL